MTDRALYRKAWRWRKAGGVKRVRLLKGGWTWVVRPVKGIEHIITKDELDAAALRAMENNGHDVARRIRSFLDTFPIKR